MYDLLMANWGKFSAASLIILVACFPAVAAYAQRKDGKYQLTQFDNYGCMAKGRVQDCNGEVMRQILADG
jgi:hypothetical protein